MSASIRDGLFGLRGLCCTVAAVWCVLPASCVTAVASARGLLRLPQRSQSSSRQGPQLRALAHRAASSGSLRLDRLRPSSRRLALTLSAGPDGKLSVTTDVAVRMVRRINDGEPFDFLVAAPAQIDELIKAGKIIPETRTDLAHSGIGVAVRAGAPKPDVSSVDAFKRALLAARSVAYLKEGQSGVYVAGLLERLGIAEAIRSKVTLPETDIVSELVSRGEIELGIVVITQILTTDGVALAGPLPSEIQSYITFTGGISANSKSIDAAKELMKVLKSPAAIRRHEIPGHGARQNREPDRCRPDPAAPGVPRRLPGRPVVGASVVVRRLSAVRDALQAPGLKPVAGTSGTILLPPGTDARNLAGVSRKPLSDVMTMGDGGLRAAGTRVAPALAVDGRLPRSGKPSRLIPSRRSPPRRVGMRVGGTMPGAPMRRWWCGSTRDHRDRTRARGIAAPVFLLRWLRCLGDEARLRGTWPAPDGRRRPAPAPRGRAACSSKRERVLQLAGVSRKPQTAADSRASVTIDAPCPSCHFRSRRFFSPCATLSAQSSALADLERAAAANPSDVQAQRRLAAAYEAAGRRLDAVAAWTRVTELAPQAPSGWYALGLAYSAVAQEAVRSFEDRPADAAWRQLLMADSLLATGHLTDAFVIYRSVEEQLPSMVTIHESVAQIYERSGHAAWAARERTRGVLSADACATRKALCEFRAGRYRGALEAALAGSDAESRYWLARIARELARASYAHLDTLADSPERRASRATIARAEDRHQDAVTELTAALKLAPGNPTLTFELATACYAARDYEQALATVNPLLRARPDDPRLVKLAGLLAVAAATSRRSAAAPAARRGDRPRRPRPAARARPRAPPARRLFRRDPADRAAPRHRPGRQPARAARARLHRRRSAGEGRGAARQIAGTAARVGGAKRGGGAAEDRAAALTVDSELLKRGGRVFRPGRGADASQLRQATPGSRCLRSTLEVWELSVNARRLRELDSLRRSRSSA